MSVAMFLVLRLLLELVSSESASKSSENAVPAELVTPDVARCGTAHGA